MKKTAVAVSIAALLSLLALGRAMAGQGADAPRDSIFHAEDLSWLSVGAGWDYVDRKLESPPAVNAVLESRGLYGFVSADITDWLSLNAGAGESELKAQPGGGYGDEEFMWTAGGKIRFWEHAIAEPSFLESLLSLQGSASYWEHNPEGEDGSYDWTEWRYQFVACLEVPANNNDSGLDNLFSTVFYGGVVGSSLEIDSALYTGFDNGTEYEEEEQWGAVAGLDANVARNLSIGVEVRFFEDPSYSVTGAFHF